MKQWLVRMGQRFSRFMYGRYGTDELNRCLMIVSLILLLLACFRPLWWLYLPAVAVLIWSYVRCFSRNIYKRRRENQAYLRLKRPLTAFFTLQKNKHRDRKTHCYFKCKSCKAVLRVPKGRGEIDVTCPKCGKITVKRT